MSVADAIAGVLSIVGAVLVLLAGVGVLRFPDLYSRAHAATKATAVGILLIAIAAAVAIDGGAAKILLAAVFVLITSPAAAHVVGRAAYRVEGVELRIDGPDELRDALGDGDD